MNNNTHAFAFVILYSIGIFFAKSLKKVMFIAEIV